MLPQQLQLHESLSYFVSTDLISRTRGVLADQSSSAQKSPPYLLRNLCFLVMLLCPLSSSLQRTASVQLFYLTRIGRIENLFSSTCGYSTQETFHLILLCPATDPWRRSLFGNSSLYDLWSRPWGVAGLLGFHGLPPCPYASKGVG